jgi:hypothetical protein
MRNTHADRHFGFARTDPTAVRFLKWFDRGGGRAITAWHERWRKALDAPDIADLDALDAALRSPAPLADDLELEEEMLDALRQLIALTRELNAARVPSVHTSHRIVGNDTCHFSAAVSMPDDPAQPTGRLLLTSTRAAFAGGARLPPLPWHAVRAVVQDGRDVVFVLAIGDRIVRFRCNSFADAVCGAAIARHLSKR